MERTTITDQMKRSGRIGKIDMKKELSIRGEIKTLDIEVSNEKIYVLTDQNIKVFHTKDGAYISNIGSKGKGRGQFYLPQQQ